MWWLITIALAYNVPCLLPLTISDFRNNKTDSWKKMYSETTENCPYSPCFTACANESLACDNIYRALLPDIVEQTCLFPRNGSETILLRQVDNDVALEAAPNRIWVNYYSSLNHPIQLGKHVTRISSNQTAGGLIILFSEKQFDPGLIYRTIFVIGVSAVITIIGCLIKRSLPYDLLENKQPCNLCTRNRTSERT